MKNQNPDVFGMMGEIVTSLSCEDGDGTLEQTNQQRYSAVRDSSGHIRGRIYHDVNSFVQTDLSNKIAWSLVNQTAYEDGGETPRVKRDGEEICLRMVSSSFIAEIAATYRAAKRKSAPRRLANGVFIRKMSVTARLAA